MIRDRDIHRCPGCAGWKIRTRDCETCRLLIARECMDLFRLRQALQHEHTIAMRQRVLRGVA